MKQPLNRIDIPVNMTDYIIRDPPRAISSGKQYKVSVGDVLRSDETLRPEDGGGILAVAHDKNQTRYGKSSARFVVNKNFRPPSIPPQENVYSLTRMPVERPWGRTNPNGGDYRPDVANAIDMDRTIRDDILVGEIPATYRVRIGQTMASRYEGAPPLVLDRNIPATSATAGLSAQYTSYEGQHGEEVLEWFDGDFKKQDVPLDAGVHNPMRLDAPTPLIYMELSRKEPAVSATAHARIPYEIRQHDPKIELQEKIQARNVFAHSKIRHDGIDYNNVSTDDMIRDDVPVISYRPRNSNRVHTNNINRSAPELHASAGKPYVFSESRFSIPTPPVDHRVTLKERGVAPSNVLGGRA